MTTLFVSVSLLASTLLLSSSGALVSPRHLPLATARVGCGL